MPRFDDRAREELLDEYARLKAQNISDAQIARRFGVSQMTILRWKQKYDLSGRAPPPATEPFPAPRVAELQHRGAIAPASRTTSDVEDDLLQENTWLRELAGRLLLENEQLRARLAGRLKSGASPSLSASTQTAVSASD